mgnify:CR=1 FL=1
MKIILLKDIAKVGKRYEVKEISDGYAQNMLIPKGLAIAATPDALKRVDLEKARDEGEKKVHLELLHKNLKDLDGVTVSIAERANEKGHLFAAIHKQTRIQIAPEHIMLDKHIKEVGAHVVEVKAGDKSIKFTLDIKAK